MNRKTLAALVIGLMLGTSGSALATIYSVATASGYSDAMANDLYNGNTKNGIPTPNSTGVLSEVTGGTYDLFGAADLLTHYKFGFSSNQALDSHLVGGSSFATKPGQLVSFFVLGRGALNIDTLGYYQRTLNGATVVKSNPLVAGVSGFDFTGTGMKAAPFQAVDFNAPTGSGIGWYLDVKDWRNGVTTTFYSEAALNSDGYNHMITYALPELKGLTSWIKDSTGKSVQHTFSDNAYLIGFKDRTDAPSNTPGYGITLGDDDYNDIMILVDGNTFVSAPPMVPEPATFVLVGAGLAGLWVMSRRKQS